MAAKPMPRLRAGISGTPILSSAAKRSLPLHVKAKSESRGSTRHAGGSASTLSKKGSVLPVNHCDKSTAESIDNSSNIKPLRIIVNDESCSSSQSTWDKVCSQLDFSAKNPGLEKLRVTLDDNSTESTDSTQDSEACRLKQLMILQISLISRQQDLLKLRDKEIMQLKQATQSYKSRLNRMERRIHLSRRQYVNSSSNLNKNLKLNDKNNDDSLIETTKDSEFDMNVEISCIGSSQNTIASSITPNCESHLHQGKLNDSADLDKVTSPTSKDRSTASFPNMEFTSPVSLVRSAYAASGCIPVPASYVDRIKKHLPSPAVANTFSQPVVIKVCEHCAHCTSMIGEIKKELAHSDHDFGLGVSKVVVSEEKIKLDAIAEPSGATVDVSDRMQKLSDETNLQVHHPYYLITWPRDDQFYPFTDLDLALDEGSVLNIPTWKVNKLTPLSSSSASSQVKEVIDDDSLSKRHSRLEVAEKRRKRWDIQRIREYRYNEKLRQKKLKQTEDSAFESFSPSLNDINAVQVEETLPVNAFGHLLKPLQLEEFSLDSN